MEAERVACPRCGESILSVLEVCSKCGQSALVVVAPAAPLADARLRYLLARRLVEEGSPLPLGELLKALERGEAVTRGMTHAATSGVRAAFAAAGVEAATRQPSAPRPQASSGAPAAVASTASRIGSRASLAPRSLPTPHKLFSRLELVLAGGAVLLLGTLVFLLVRGRAAPPNASAATPGASAAPLSPQAVAQSTLPSIVKLRCDGGLGTGFFVAENKLVTNAHVTCGDKPIEVEMRDGRKGEARTERADGVIDAAVLTVTDLTGKPLSIASAGDLVAGDTLMVAGHPRGMDFTFHIGNVSNPHRVVLDVNYLQADARINPGNSGGPALDARGRVVGIVSMGRPGSEGLGMALPIDYLYEGDQPLLPPPAWHPTPGFRAMLAKADEEKRTLIAQQTEIGVRLIDIKPGGNGRLVAVVTTLSSLPPREQLPFRLENAGADRCNVDADTRWQKSAPTEGFAKRVDDFFKREGLGDAYYGFAMLDFGNCHVSEPTKLILVIGPEAENTIQLD